MKVFDDYYSPITYAAKLAADEDITYAMEFGVASGLTINIISKHIKEVHGFDSFEGLPEDWRAGFSAGMFAQAPPQVGDNVTLHIGWFEDTLPRFMANRTLPQKLIHMDCDLYGSTETILREIGDQIASGDIIVFDEFSGYEGWIDHEAKAWEEYTESNGTRSELLAIGPEQMVLRIL